MCESADPNDAKRALRAQMRGIRRSIAADSQGRAARSHTICERVAAAMTSTIGEMQITGRRLMVYEPLAAEPDVGALVEWAKANGLAVFVPEIAGPDLRVMPGDIDPSTLDAVVVPGLAFTRDGTRLGQGGGHFDRFLPRLRSGCLRIGVAFHEQLVDDVPLEAHDIALDFVVTDE